MPSPIPSCWASTNSGRRHITEVNARKDIMVAVVKIRWGTRGNYWQVAGITCLALLTSCLSWGPRVSLWVIVRQVRRLLCAFATREGRARGGGSVETQKQHSKGRRRSRICRTTGKNKSRTHETANKWPRKLIVHVGLQGTDRRRVREYNAPT